MTQSKDRADRAAAHDMARPKTTAALDSRRRRGRAVAWSALGLSLAVFLFSLAQWAGVLALGGGDALAQDVRPPSNAVNVTGAGAPSGPPDAVEGRVPGGSLGNASDSQLWGAVREGDSFTVSIPDKNAAILVQSAGEEWRALRNGPLAAWFVYGLAGMVALLALFFLIRGRIRIEHGPAGQTIQRFNGFERFGHWLLAVSFILLALTGLNLIYGRYVVLPVVGKEAFASITAGGKWVHNNVAFAFMAGLVIIFFQWVLHNIPNRTDLQWMAKGGGLFVKGVHPDSRKFNAGQKMIFWATILLGASLSLSGIALLFPNDTAMMAKTFEILNMVGFDLETNLTATQEMQYQATWHGIVSVVMTAIIIAHIYIGSVGMQGAFDAMGSGEVDLNWAKEHHNLWVEEEQAKGRAPASGATPAE